MRNNKSEARDSFFSPEVGTESCMRVVYILKQGFGICAQPCGSFPHSLKCIKSEQMFGKQEPRVSAMKSFNSCPQSCLQHWLGSVFQKMMISFLPDLMPGVAPAAAPVSPRRCTPLTGSSPPGGWQPGWQTHRAAKGLNERGKHAARWGPSGQPRSVRTMAKLGNLHSSCPGSIWSVNNWRAFHHRGCRSRYLRALYLVVSF